jgi:CRISPR-associated protein Cas5t
MSEKTLFVEIFQPFAQYRNPFTFYYAQSYPLPPKSTIIGMLQNATDRYYDEDFWNLKVSVHGGFESVYWNYQNLIKGDITLVKRNGDLLLWNQERPLYHFPLKSQRSPVCQQELFNGHIYLFIRGSKELLNEIEDALDCPKKVLTLGRSEDVIFIRRIVSNIKPKKKSSSKEIWLTYPTYIKLEGLPIKRERFPVYSIPIEVKFLNNGKSIKNKAELSESTEREIKFEKVLYTGTEYILYLKEKKDIERYEIESEDNDKSLTFKIPSEFGWL